jgi:lipopolysaccharide/colanic/teichoic acid biosynthesis glycosyltransferase
MIRLFDLLFSFLGLIILLPVLIVLWIIGIFENGSPLFKQKRVGHNQKVFVLFKFRTMHIDTKSVPTHLVNKLMVTKFGSFLRRTKLDELPQLFNVLIGDMSFVGPRPVMAISFNAYPSEVQSVIYKIKPGLTGIGSIIFRDEEELITSIKNKGEDTWGFYTNKIYPFKGEVEQWYQANFSFIVDIKIILITAYVIIFPSSTIVYESFSTLPKRDF